MWNSFGPFDWSPLSIRAVAIAADLMANHARTNVLECGDCCDKYAPAAWASLVSSKSCSTLPSASSLGTKAKRLMRARGREYQSKKSLAETMPDNAMLTWSVSRGLAPRP